MRSMRAHARAPSQEATLSHAKHRPHMKTRSGMQVGRVGAFQEGLYAELQERICILNNPTN